ncbi:MAG: hypothetical protein R3Y36_00625 [Spirochaetales bacterium]
MISNVGNISAIVQANYSSGLSSVTASGTGKLYIPINPALVMYSQFEHVAGIPAENGSGGVNINKIKILNTLIDRLVDMKQKPDIAQDSQELSDAQVDALIEDYQSRIQNIIGIAQSNPYALSGATPAQAGALFSVAS